MGATPAVAAAGAPAATPPAPTSTPAPVPGVPVAGTATVTPPAATAAASQTAAPSRSPSAAPVYGNGSANQDTRESAAARPAPLRAPADLDDDDEGGLTTGRIAAYVVGAVAAVAIGIVLMISLTGDDSTPTTPNDFGDTPAASSDDTSTVPGTTSGTAGSANTLSAAERRATKVAVLNGTTRTGLARTVGDRIEKARFTLGAVTNNVDQAVPATIISYTAGNRPAALVVAKSIEVDSGSVQEADANTTTAAADADVVVTVGSDQIE